MATSLLLLHGFTHTGASWRRVIEHLGENYRPLAPDLRGHGSASATEPVDLASVLADLRASTPPRFVLGGYSMGGRIALHVALAMPERVERLVLIGASPGLADPQEQAERRAADDALAARVEMMSIQAFTEEWARTPVLAGLPPDVLAEVHADRLRSTPTGLARALRGLGTGALRPLWGRLAEVTTPVHLIVGARDAKFTGIAEQMAERLPASEIEVVSGVGHAVHLEAPEYVAASLEQTVG